MMPEGKLREARCLLLAREPWYGYAAMTIDWTASERVDSMGVRIADSGRTHCHYNPTYVKNHSVEELYSVIQHEIEHIVRCHCTRAKGRSARLWNLAADMCVNGRRDRPRIGYRQSPSATPIIPEANLMVWIPDAWPEGSPAETYYRSLLEAGDRLVDRMPSPSLDDHSLWDQTAVSPEDARAVAVGMARFATGRANGRTPSHLAEYLQELTDSNMPWHTLLKRYVRRNLGTRRTTYSRRNRRRDLFGVPGYVQRSNGNVAVIVDVSGSVDSCTLERFFGEIEVICRHASVSVLLWDHVLREFWPSYRQGDWRRIPIHGRGGTDMIAPFQWLREKGRLGDCVVMLTDGYCRWPERCYQCDFVAVVAAPPDQIDPPTWGKTIFLPVKTTT